MARTLGQRYQRQVGSGAAIGRGDAQLVVGSVELPDLRQRDRALDTYERVLQKHLDGLRTQHAEENRRLEEEINQRVAELRARIDQNHADVKREEHELTTWQTRKRIEESRIAEAVGHFVSPNPITTSTAPVKDKGGSDVR